MKARGKNGVLYARWEHPTSKQHTAAASAQLQDQEMVHVEAAWRHFADMAVSVDWVLYPRCPYTESPTIWGSMLGPLIF